MFHHNWNIRSDVIPCRASNLQKFSTCNMQIFVTIVLLNSVENKAKFSSNFICGGKIVSEMGLNMLPGPLFIEQTDVLSQDLVKSRSREIRILTFLIAIKYDRHLGSRAAEMPVKFQIDTIIMTSNLAASRLHEIRRQDVLSLSEERLRQLINHILVSQMILDTLVELLCKTAP